MPSGLCVNESTCFPRGHCAGLMPQNGGRDILSAWNQFGPSLAFAQVGLALSQVNLKATSLPVQEGPVCSHEPAL